MALLSRLRRLTKLRNDRNPVNIENYESIRLWLGIAIVTVTALTCPVSANGADVLLFKEPFDTFVVGNKNIFSCDTSAFDVEGGELVMRYQASMQNGPGHLSCTLPLLSREIETRTIEMNFRGGGTDMSNSLFVCYSIGAGEGLPLPGLPNGSYPNTRTGYIARYIRHGDGTNELIVYRIDTGTAVPLKNDWFPVNPIMALRKIVIRHGRSGAHEVTSVFDTGSLIARRFEFQDSLYPPTDNRRELHLLAKGHVNSGVGLVIRCDTWVVMNEVNLMKNKSHRHPSDTRQRTIK